MSWFRFTMLTAAAAVAVMVATSRAQLPARPEQPAVPPPPPKLDFDAKQAFSEAVEKLDRKRLPWIETTLWQQMEIQGLLFQSPPTFL